MEKSKVIKNQTSDDKKKETKTREPRTPVMDEKTKLRINYLLIRELYRLVCTYENKGNMSQFYIYLFGDFEEYFKEKDQENILKKCRNRFCKFLEIGEGDMTGANNKLFHIGIPDKYFIDTLFNINEEIEKQIEISFLKIHEKQEAERGKKYFKIFQSLLKNYYEDITINNGDEEIPVIVFMSDLHRRILKLSELKKEFNKKIRDEICKMMGEKSKEEIVFVEAVPGLYYWAFKEAEKEENIQFEIAKNIMTSKIHKNMGMKEIKALYQEIIQKGYADSNYIERIEEAKVKNIYKNRKPSDEIKYNYFVIREVYRLFSDLEDMEHAMERFYDFLGTSQNEYQEIIKTGIADNQYFYAKLCSFQFPVSMFRGDNPVIMNMNNELKHEVENYFRKIEEAEKKFNKKQIGERECKEKRSEYLMNFRYFLKLEICYMHHIENHILVFAVARMLEAIKENT